VNPTIEAYASTLPPMMADLVRLCPNATPPTNHNRFVEKHQAHFVVVDDDSEKAARFTLQQVGGDVTEVAAMGMNLHLWFQDEERAGEGISFYQQLPMKLDRFTASDMVALLKRIRE
jgi:hypothetical protein